MILAYVERERGPGAVVRLLRACGLEADEEALRADNNWFDYPTKIRLLDAAADVLDDPDAAYHIGRSAVALNVGSGLKLALRAFGSPRTAYANVSRITRAFTWTHSFDAIELADGAGSFRYADMSGVGYHRADCQYNIGMLECMPTMFDFPPARVNHPRCALRGADACVYEVTWESRASSVMRQAAGWLGASAATAGALALAAPRRRAALAAVPAMGTVMVARQALVVNRQRARGLEDELRDQKDAAEHLVASLRDMVSDLRIDEVLTKITQNAQHGVVGKEFALLVAEGAGLRSASRTGIPTSAVVHLERWAAGVPELRWQPVVLEHLDSVPELAELSRHPQKPLGSLYAVPLIFRGARLGVLLACDHGPRAFLPHEARLLETYADQAAIALANAHMVERLEMLARQDPLTGLLNHREFHETVERELDRASRYNHRMCVVLLDLDGFKRVNDERGHVEGDLMLERVAREVEQASRASDAAFRIGGDEFALVLPESEAADAMAVAHRVREAVARLDDLLGVSFGVAEWPAHGPSKDALLRHADACLYEAKPEFAGSRRSRRLTPARAVD